MPHNEHILTAEGVSLHLPPCRLEMTGRNRQSRRTERIDSFHVSLGIVFTTLGGLSLFLTWYIYASSALGELSTSTGPTTDHPLDRMLRAHVDVIRAPPTRRGRPQKPLLFAIFGDGQGAGNILNGLLSTHLLADEFNRTVCITPEYSSFLMAFRPSQTYEEQHFCKDAWTHHTETEAAKPLRIVNFDGNATSECTIRQVLASNDPVIIKANTYPRWPHVPKDYFLLHYEPTPLLLSIVPWPKPPQMVVHLRKEDNRQRDRREGLDEETFYALGKALPLNDTFLVTNMVDWYAFFEQHFGWSNPGWQVVKHSALSYTWGNANATDSRGNMFENLTKAEIGGLQMWSDWYTLLMAEKEVWHTRSDFSTSAAHWMGKASKTIKGTEMDQVGNRVLDLVPDDTWIHDGETPRLIDRPLNDLQGCDAVSENTSGSVKRKTAR